MNPIWKTISNIIDPKAWADALNPATGFTWNAQPPKAGTNYVSLTLTTKNRSPYALTLIVEVPSTGALLAMMVVTWHLPSGKGRVAVQAPLIAAQSPERLIRNTRNYDLKKLFSPSSAVKAWQEEGEEALFERRASHMDNDLRQKIIRLAHSNRDLRPVLLPLLKEAFQLPVDDTKTKNKGTGRGPSAIMQLFLHSHGDDPVKNPNYDSKNPKTKRDIKVKSLPSIKGPNRQKAMQQFNDMLEKFEESAAKKKLDDKFKAKKKKRLDPEVKEKGKNVENKDIKRRKKPTKKELDFGGIGKFKLAAQQIIQRIDNLDLKLAKLNHEL